MLAAIGAVLATPVSASETPRAGAADRRVRSVEYLPGQVYRIVGAFRAVTEIAFAPNEAIVTVTAGDTVSWEVVARDHQLFVKPREHAGPSNLIVTTARGGNLRDYVFELVANGRTGEGAFFRVQFRYPEDERLEKVRLAALQAALALARVEKEAVTAALDHGVVEGSRNTRYTVEGAADLQPSEVTDNGRFTVLRFPANREVPSIFLVRDDGSETLVPFDIRGEFVVIHLVAKRLRLRRNAEVLCIYNEALQPYGVNAGTDTASPQVQRALKDQPR